MLRIVFCLVVQGFCFLREGECQGCVAVLTLDEVLEAAVRLFAVVKLERIQSFFYAVRVLAVQLPVSGLNCIFLCLLGKSHAALHTMLDARAVADDQ